MQSPAPSQKYLRALLIASADKQAPFNAVLSLSSGLGIRIANNLPAFKLDIIEELMRDSTIHAIIVDSRAPGYSGEEFLSLRSKSPRPVALVGLASSGTAEFEQLLGMGLDGVYSSTPTESSIQAMVDDLPRKYVELEKNWGGGAWDVAPNTIRAALEQATKTSFMRAVASFWSPKGGEGKTTITTETAAVLAVTTHLNVCILDGNMIHGHQRLNTGVGSPTQSIVAAAKQAAGIADSQYRDREFAAVIDRHLVSVGNLPNLKLLPGIMSPANAREREVVGTAGAAFAEALVRYLRTKFDFVLIDLGSALDKVMHESFLRNSDFVIVIGGPNRNSLLDIATDINTTLADKIVAKDRFRLVLNKWRNCGINLDQVTETIGLPISATIRPAPEDTLLTLQNLGKSFVAEYHKAKPGKQAREIEDTLRDFANVAGLLYPGVAELWAARGKKK